MIKTYKNKAIVNLESSTLLWSLAKWTINLKFNFNSHSILNTAKCSIYLCYFLSSFWRNFKNTFTKKLGTITSNITKTAYYLFFDTLFTKFTYNNKTRIKTSKITNYLPYLQTHTLIPFNFNNQVYNTLMFYFISLINTFYTPTQTEFKLYYAFLWKNPNLTHYDFLNKYYFKLKNY